MRSLFLSTNQQRWLKMKDFFFNYAGMDISSEEYFLLHSPSRRSRGAVHQTERWRSRPTPARHWKRRGRSHKKISLTDFQELWQKSTLMISRTLKSPRKNSGALHFVSFLFVFEFLTFILCLRFLKTAKFTKPYSHEYCMKFHCFNKNNWYSLAPKIWRQLGQTFLSHCFRTPAVSQEFSDNWVTDIMSSSGWVGDQDNTFLWALLGQNLCTASSLFTVSDSW